jgi:hypothetical protein
MMNGEWTDSINGGKHRLVEQNGKWRIYEIARPLGAKFFSVSALDDALGAFDTIEDVHAAIASESRFS